jgi:predicted nucleotidyltransferase component of viral defense system
MDELHRILLRIGFDAGEELGLVLAGGYAIAAHSLVDRPSKDIDFATSSSIPLPLITERLADAYRAAGYRVETREAGQRMARLRVSTSTAICEVDLLKEAIGPPVQLSIGPVLALPDAVGLKLRALHDRAAHRDFIDAHAASSEYSTGEMERLAAQHTEEFSFEELADRLGGFDALDEDAFLFYGLEQQQIEEIRQWAHRWESDIRSRLAAGEVSAGRSFHRFDAYLDG